MAEAWDVADLLALLDVKPDATGRCISPPQAAEGRMVVEGSQLLAQAVVAAGRSYPGRRAVAGQMAFHRIVEASKPIEFVLTEHSNGRTFTALGVDVQQDGRGRAIGTLLLDTPSEDVMRHHAAPPQCAGPDESPAYEMGVTGREIRIVDGAYDNDPDAPIGPPVIDAWVRYRDVPSDPYLNAALLVHLTGHMSVAAAMRPHAGIGQAQAHHTLSTGINAVSIALHADIRADRWLRFHHLSTFAGDGQTHAECRVYDEDEALVASFTVTAMVRALRTDGRPADTNRVL
jgi:acyl-CoA thioesterase